MEGTSMGHCLTRRERLQATLRGQTVDRPAVNLYEVGGFPVDPHDPDPYNIYHAPDWQPLLQLAPERQRTVRLIRASSLLTLVRAKRPNPCP